VGYVSQPTGGIDLPIIVVNLFLITIDCHHESGFGAVANELISLCEKLKIASQDKATKRGSQ